MGPHLSRKSIVSRRASHAYIGHALWMSCLRCELPRLLEESRPPDPELVDLIEQAFLEGQIDGLPADLACAWLLRRSAQFDRI